jgi:hypothetical protein
VDYEEAQRIDGQKLLLLVAPRLRVLVIDDERLGEPRGDHQVLEPHAVAVVERDGRESPSGGTEFGEYRAQPFLEGTARADLPHAELLLGPAALEGHDGVAQAVGLGLLNHALPLERRRRRVSLSHFGRQGVTLELEAGCSGLRLRDCFPTPAEGVGQQQQCGNQRQDQQSRLMHGEPPAPYP